MTEQTVIVNIQKIEHAGVGVIAADTANHDGSC
jgi:hypothetical protein